MATALERLSSGLRINSAADDPAGLIISELLRSDMAAVSQAVDNTTRGINVIQTAEGALNEVNALLVDIRDLVVEAASTGALTAEEIEANQLQIDSAVESIARIAKSTNFGGTALLNGGMDYITSGVTTANIVDLSIYATQFGTSDTMTVALNVTDSATLATLAYTNSAISAATTLEIGGVKGSEVLSLAQSAAVSAVSFAVNQLTDVTGVSSYVSTNNYLYLTSVEYGTDQFISTETLSGSIPFNGAETNRAVGTDAEGTINGTAVQADGNTLTINTTVLDLRMDVAAGFAGTETFAITGGGALFQIGPDVQMSQQVNIGIQSVAPHKLGSNSVGFLHDIVTGGQYSLTDGQADNAAKIIDQAVLDVSTLRGRLGSLQLNTFETNINSLEVYLENLTAAESTIRDADFAAETANLTRAQILVSAGTSVLATANAAPQVVLALLV